jgi:hypothetical protein
MVTWTEDELTRIGEEDELQLSSLRSDGTLTKPVTIWVARVGGDLYVRPVKGREGWHRATQIRHAGHISSAGVEKDVRFEDADRSLDAQLDEAFTSKYRKYPERYVAPLLTEGARDAGLRLIPR